jgi:hypothetical protein
LLRSQPMLITDSFVMLNYPKSGSSFAREVIKKLCPHREVLVNDSWHKGPPHQHGSYLQIPSECRGREVVTVVRNPYTRFLSGYEFRHWEYNPGLPLDVIKRRFPHFPDLSIHDYLDFNQFILKPNAMIGEQTSQFIRMFFARQPKTITNKYVDSDEIYEDVADMTLLRQENLREELAFFLQRHGYSVEQTGFIARHEAVNVTAKRCDRRALLVPRVIDYVTHRERLIFRILASRGIRYTSPTKVAA